MILNDKEAATRLDSPMNLINRLKNGLGKDDKSRKNAMSLFIRSKNEDVKDVKDIIPFQRPSEIIPQKTSDAVPGTKEPVLNDILEDPESQVKLGLAHNTALELLHNSLNALSAKLDDVKADRLPSVIAAASKTVESIRRERAEAFKQGKEREVHYHFYTPQQKSISDYKVIDVESSLQSEAQ